MKNVAVPCWMMKDLREMKDLEPDDTSKDDEILAMGGKEFLDAWLVWLGIIGYTDDILEAIYYAYGVDLDGCVELPRVTED